MGQEAGRPERYVIQWLTALVVLIVCGILGAGLPHIVERRAAARFPVTSEALEIGRAQLDELAVDRPGGSSVAGVPDYERSEFGTAWADLDFNGCDTRNDILARDLDLVVESERCVVDSGELTDPYTDEVITFVRGPESSRVQIDHVVALKDAWYAGAWRWELQVRRRFANDPENLLAVSGSANQKKGAATADEWLPPNTGYHCVYALRQIAVKHRYRLSVTTAEHAALDRSLSACAVAR